MKVGNPGNHAPDTPRAGAESDVYSHDRDHEQADLRLAHSGAGKRGLHDQQDHREQCSGGEPGKPKGGRVPDAGGENLQAIQAELSHQTAIRDIGKLALAFVMADIGAYEKWFFEKYGVKPEL